MSESGIMHNLMRQIEEKARDREAERVVRVTLRVGALADVTEPRLRERFAIEARDTLAEDAVLTIIQESNPSQPHAKEVRLERIDVDG
ncbi:hydrogenase maturation nickel metallochaperone HypA [bacterium]|nr:hydrogenase maturation nickel metallochaperone HypA [bacterium]